jgi:hypothetical protein
MEALETSWRMAIGDAMYATVHYQGKTVYRPVDASLLGAHIAADPTIGMTNVADPRAYVNVTKLVACRGGGSSAQKMARALNTPVWATYEAVGSTNSRDGVDVPGLCLDKVLTSLFRLAHVAEHGIPQNAMRNSIRRRDTLKVRNYWSEKCVGRGGAESIAWQASGPGLLVGDDLESRRTV